MTCEMCTVPDCSKASKERPTPKVQATSAAGSCAHCADSVCFPPAPPAPRPLVARRLARPSLPLAALQWPLRSPSGPPLSPSVPLSMQMSNLSGGSGGGDLTDPAEWLRSFESVEGTLEGCANELNDAQAKGIGNRQKRSINKKGRGEQHRQGEQGNRAQTMQSCCSRPCSRHRVALLLACPSVSDGQS